MDDQSPQDFVKSPSAQEDSLPRPLLRGGGILSGAEALVEGLRYQPRTRRREQLSNLHLGDMTQEIIRSATDATLEYLKDEDLKDFEKKEEIDNLLGAPLSPKEFNELVNLSKEITDYDVE